MTVPLRVLLVEDSPDDAELLLDALRSGGYEPTPCRVETPAELVMQLDAGSWDVILADHMLPSFNSLAALSLVKQRALDVPFLVVSGTIADEEAVSAMRAGAHDYLLKGNLARLVPAIRRELEDAVQRRRRRAAERRLAYLAHHDPATGLPNRQVIEEEIDVAVAAGAAKMRGLAVFSVGIAELPGVRETFGEAHADLLLQQIAARLNTALPSASGVARVGEDRLALFCAEDLRSEIALEFAAQIAASFEPPFTVQRNLIGLGCRIGVALAPAHGADGATLLRRACMALQVGREQSGAALYRPEMDGASAERLMLLGELQRALDEDELALVYQPKVDVRNQDVRGLEALIRWHHPERGPIAPSVFIPLAERAGVIERVTEWVLRAASLQLAVWSRQGTRLPVAVNLSAGDLQRISLADEIDAVCGQHSLDPSLLGFEVTESAMMAERDQPLTSLERLRSEGFRLALDDFGTGYSSLSYLKNLPVHELKIDRSFVRSALGEGKDRAILTTVVDLGNTLGLEVVAEGVEDEETMEVVRSVGCSAAQGYHISPPLAPDDVPRWIDAWSRRCAT